MKSMLTTQSSSFAPAVGIATWYALLSVAPATETQGGMGIDRLSLVHIDV